MVTIEDIARAAGVSTGTVDRVLHKRGKCSQSATEKVQAAIAELNYKPNILARNLARGKTCKLAVLIPSQVKGNEYWSRPLQGMRDYIDEIGSNIFSLHEFLYERYDEDDYCRAIDSLIESDYDGYLVAPLIPNITQEFLENLSANKPLVFFNTDLKDSPRMAYVGQDTYSGGLLAAKLMNLWHIDYINRNNKVYIMTPKMKKTNDHIVQRIRGIKNGLKIEPELLVIDEYKYNTEDKVLGFLDDELAKNEVGGVITVDSSAYIFAHWKVTNKLKFPIIGYDLIQANKDAIRDESIQFILTQRPYEQGYNAIRLLYQNIIMGNEDIEDMIMPIDIITQENLDGFKW